MQASRRVDRKLSDECARVAAVCAAATGSSGPDRLARNLTSACSRKRVANGLAGVLRSAESSGPRFTAAIRPRSEQVLETRAVIASIERQFRASGPVAARGVALIRLLLIDGNGPLYRPSDAGALADCLRAAAAALAYARD